MKLGRLLLIIVLAGAISYGILAHWLTPQQVRGASLTYNPESY